MRALRPISTLWVCAALVVGCDGDPGAPDTGVPTDTGVSVDTGTGGGACTAQVVIAFFTDPDCTMPVMAGEPTRTYDTTLSCFGWSGSSAAGQNSATNFQCYRDRLCYTQHPATLDCMGASFTDKEARTDVCLLDTSNPSGGGIYAQIVSGTESCPDAPAGFECPSSASGAGTPGIAACTTAP